jgi:hypothetical protein
MASTPPQTASLSSLPAIPRLHPMTVANSVIEGQTYCYYEIVALKSGAAQRAACLAWFWSRGLGGAPDEDDQQAATRCLGMVFWAWKNLSIIWSGGIKNNQQ